MFRGTKNFSNGTKTVDVNKIFFVFKNSLINIKNAFNQQATYKKYIIFYKVGYLNK